MFSPYRCAEVFSGKSIIEVNIGIWFVNLLLHKSRVGLFSRLTKPKNFFTLEQPNKLHYVGPVVAEHRQKRRSVDRGGK
jgi:hypothetical protein